MQAAGETETPQAVWLTSNNMTIHSDSSYYHALLNNDLETVKKELNTGNYNIDAKVFENDPYSEHTALLVALEKGHEPIVRYLIGCEANVLISTVSHEFILDRVD